MAHRKSRLKLNHQGLAINADIYTKKLSPENLGDQPEIIRRDEQSGDLVVRQLYDKATDETLEEGYGYRWVTEEGEEVPKEDIVEYVVEDGEEEHFSRHEPTLGRDRTLEAITWIPIAQTEEYLVERTYELWAEEVTDIKQLNDLAEHIRDFEEAPVVPIVMQPSFYQDWGIITPQFFEDSFALIIRITSQKIEPDERMAYTDEADVGEAADEEAPTLEQETPFG
ncbi:MAG: hypothetical protein U5K37_00595 [Natrialbaceae archaeon]|nr:hypothetical protein [Natrialbaceae archaeon]